MVCSTSRLYRVCLALACLIKIKLMDCETMNSATIWKDSDGVLFLSDGEGQLLQLDKLESEEENKVDDY